ncbi:DUF1076 domain-containing protein [Escherichia coli]|uniref:DUF1076 domain-containing protein n=1 Tax=Escherichia coli TaxID=562 RepID=UPI0010ACA2A0|nr:DUF1076 domain-containing protein [Escherichia coli]EEU1868620.1 DUF1076 domain-containing protein [Escherichia coli]EEV9739960.1 DUF1076 domain-containing protein [Escherichia coli]EEW4932900.1 DUF1076 domain-containing protein [Escherichia coli]EEX5339407.1 DUF1076 domain-containing protein [Escherichia coli]EEX8927836.1 DUF1076 domain-containing protein [Escherichia coli]
MPLTSAIASNSFSTGMQVLRAQMAASGGGEITVGGQTVRITYSETDGRFLASGGNNSLLSGLLLTGLNGGPEALRDIMLRMVSGSGNTQSHGDIERKISQCKFSVNTESLQCPSEAVRCPIILDKPEEGVFVKNSEGSLVCTLFDSVSFSHLVRDGGKHPLTREPITSSMIVSQEQCIYDQTKGNFVIKDK